MDILSFWANIHLSVSMAISGKRDPLVMKTLSASVQGNARAKKWEWVGGEIRWLEPVGDFWDSIGNVNEINT